MTSGTVLRVFSSAAAACALLRHGGPPQWSTKQILVPSKILQVCHYRRGCRSCAGFAWRFKGSNLQTQKVGERAIDGKAVERVCLETGSVLQQYSSLRSAADSIKLSRSVIAKVCQRTRPSAEYGGYFWRFKGDQSKPWLARRPTRAKPIERLCLRTGVVLSKHDSATQAMETLVAEGRYARSRLQKHREDGHGICSGIGDVCRLQRMSAHGYFWRYFGSTNTPSNGPAKKRGASKFVEKISVRSD